MVAVVVQRAAVVHDGRDPDGCEAEVLDVVELLDESFEVSAPGDILRVSDGGVDGRVRIVRGPLRGSAIGRVTIKEARGQQEVNGLFAKVCLRLYRLPAGGQQQEQQ